MNSLSAGGSVAGSAPAQTGSEWSPLARQIVELLRQRPASGGALAKRLGVRRAAALGACRALHRAGRVQRDGNRWRLMPGTRCRGQNSYGENCGREAALGSAFCLHHEPDPGGRSMPESTWAKTPERSLTGAIDALTGEEIEVFLGALETYVSFKRRDEKSLTPDEGAEYVATLSLLHWLSCAALVRQGHQPCDCDVCDGVETAFETNDREERRAARRSLPRNIDTDPRDSTHTAASDASDFLAQEPKPTQPTPKVEPQLTIENGIIWEVPK